jgi:Ala-tRNA(Pro) deacylase
VTSDLTVHQQLVALLRDNGIEFKLSEHEEVSTSAAAAKARGVDLSTGAKALVVKADGQLVLAVVSASQRVDMAALAKLLGVPAVSLATIDEAETATGLPKGAIPAIGAVVGLPTYLDESVLEHDVVRFNAASKSHSVELRSSDLLTVSNAVVGRFSS